MFCAPSASPIPSFIKELLFISVDYTYFPDEYRILIIINRHKICLLLSCHDFHFITTDVIQTSIHSTHTSSIWSRILTISCKQSGFRVINLTTTFLHKLPNVLLSLLIIIRVSCTHYWYYCASIYNALCVFVFSCLLLFRRRLLRVHSTRSNYIVCLVFSDCTCYNFRTFLIRIVNNQRVRVILCAPNVANIIISANFLHAIQFKCYSNQAQTHICIAYV